MDTFETQPLSFVERLSSFGVYNYTKVLLDWDCPLLEGPLLWFPGVHIMKSYAFTHLSYVATYIALQLTLILPCISLNFVTI